MSPPTGPTRPRWRSTRAVRIWLAPPWSRSRRRPTWPPAWRRKSLQAKLSEARSRQAAIASRIESAVTRAKARELIHGERTEDAFARFDVLERRADMAEGYCEALGLNGPRSLE